MVGGGFDIMVTTVILTHGGLANELLAAAEVILGPQDRFRIVTLDWADTFDEARAKTEAVLSQLDSDSEVLILTDMYGGTPYNVATSLVDPGRVEVVTGVNLPMVVRIGCPDTKDKQVSELAEWIQAKARKSICRAGADNGSEKAETEPSAREERHG
jgi:PTS system mannose-specific IIA component